MPTPRFELCLCVALLAVACTTPRRAGPVPRPVQGDAPFRDLSVEGPQGVSGELIRSHASSRFMLGRQSMDPDYWGPLEDTLFAGFETAFETEGDLLGGEVGFSYAGGDGNKNTLDPVAGTGTGNFEAKLRYYELYAGPHRTFLRGYRVRPYVGAGLSVIWWDGEKEFTAPGIARHEEDNNFAFGAYLHGGLALQINENMQVGLDLRAMGGSNIDDFFGEGDLDYQRIALFFGFGD